MNDATIATLLVLAVALAVIVLLIGTERHRREHLRPVQVRSQVQHQVITSHATRNQAELRAVRSQIEEQNRQLQEDAERLEMLQDEITVRRRMPGGR